LLGEWERDLGWSKAEAAGAFTTALLLSAFLAPFVGKQIDKGRSQILFPTATLVTAVLLGALSFVTELWHFYLVWASLGVVMAGSLYEPCFAILTLHMGKRAPQSITLVTLLAGFAGTIAFPTAHALIEEIGWRGVILTFAILIGLISAPLNLYAVSQAQTANPAPPEPPAQNTGQNLNPVTLRTLVLLGFAFAAMAFDHNAILSHLLVLLDERGVHSEMAVFAAAMIGPMQVSGRLAMIAFEGRVQVVAVATAAFLSMAFATLMLFGVGSGMVFLILFVLFQGAGFGVASIVRPILIAELLGRRRFGVVAGFLAVPFLFSMAIAPSIAGMIWSIGGYHLLIVTTAIIGLSGAIALTLAARSARTI
tara:strand:+ start:907 stop:2004 length:1098 start_codon:yes stop_codon:yes gene_type:complete